jgi:hypothetical protein
MSFVLTKDQIKEEIKKCGRDPTYFINNFCKIAHPEKGLIPFALYDYQQKTIKDFEDYRFNIVLKARQLGLSTAVAGYIAWMLLFRRQKTVLVVATKLDVAANLVKKVKKMIKHIPDWLRIAEISIDNRNSFELNNGSWIKASSTSESAGRSEALSLLVIDEAAFVDDMEELWKSIFPTLSTGGRCVAVSTPNGVGNWFHETYTNAENGLNDFHAIKLNWDSHPDRDRAWFEAATRNMSARDVAQEYECSFNASGESVIDSQDLRDMRENIVEPKYRTGFDRNYWIWEEAKQQFSYFIVSDVARGDGKDFSAFHVIKIETMEQVAEYQGKVAPDIYADMLFQTGMEYNKALLVVENNNIGYNVLEKLIERKYPNLYYSIKTTHEYIEQIQAESTGNSVPGFTTTLKTRPLIVAKLEEFIRNRVIKIYSNRLVEELSTFVWNNGRPEAMKNRNDDLTMSMAIACWVRDTALNVSQRDIEYTKAMFNAITMANTRVQTRIPGQIGYNKNYSLEEQKVNTKDLKEFYKMYDWLYKG